MSLDTSHRIARLEHSLSLCPLEATSHVGVRPLGDVVSSLLQGHVSTLYFTGVTTKPKELLFEKMSYLFVLVHVSLCVYRAVLKSVCLKMK